MKVSIAVTLLAAAAAAYAIACPKNCTDATHGSCDTQTGVCQCLCANEHHCFSGVDCHKEYDPKYGWDTIDCHDGHWRGNWTDTSMRLREVPWFDRSCECPPLWTGSDCSICVNDESCRAENRVFPVFTNGTCDRSIYIVDSKRFQCNITTPELEELLHSNASMSMECRFPPLVPNSTECQLHHPSSTNNKKPVFNRRTGPPFVFGCQMGHCSIDVSSKGYQAIVCRDSQCRCTEWCAPFVRAIVEEMHGDAKFTCDANRTCRFTQLELSAFIPLLELQCLAGECYNVSHKSPKPIDPPVSSQQLAIICSGVAVIGAIAISGAWLFVDHRAVLSQTPDPKDDAATLSFTDVTCVINGKGAMRPRRLLSGISGVARPGELVAILGASGAGKTTLIDILAGRKNTGNVSGTITINGRPITEAPRRMIGFVSQDDVLLGTLTCREHMLFSAALRLPEATVYGQRLARVDELLHSFGLDKVADSRIGTVDNRGISGGERKRLCIATELIAKPRVLFLDEPTSGLDAHSAALTVDYLKSTATSQQCAVVMSIHQPRSNIFSMFDGLVLLSRGCAVFSGRASDALPWFEERGFRCPEHFNPADFLIDTLQSSFVEALPKHSAAPTPRLAVAPNAVVDERSHLLSRSPVLSPSSGVVEVVVDASAPSSQDVEYDEFVTSIATQLFVLSHRTLLHGIRNPFLIRLQYGVTVGVGLLLGGLYWRMSDDLQHGGIQNRMGVLFFLVCLLGFLSLTSLDTFISERTLFVRERLNGCYRTSTYYASKLLCDFIPQRVVPPLVLGSIVYAMSGLRRDDPIHVAFFLVVLVLLSVAATSVALSIGSVTPSVAVGNLAMIVFLFLGLAFGGFLVMKSGMPLWLRPACFASLFNYAYEALLVNELDGIWVRFNPSGHEVTPVNGRELLVNMGLNPQHLVFDVSMLAAMASAFVVIGYLLLRFVVKERR